MKVQSEIRSLVRQRHCKTSHPPNLTSRGTCAPSTMSAYLSDQFKNQGNAHFKNGEYDEAVSLYSQAIQKNPGNFLLYTNRAKRPPEAGPLARG